MNNQYLVFDIETSPLPWESFSESQQEYLLRNLATEEEMAKRKTELGLSPFTAQIVCIGLLYVEIENNNTTEFTPVAYCIDNEFDDEREEICDIDFDAKLHITNEKQAIEKFWKILQKYPTIHLVSFNGRNFDSPFLMLRSALLGCKPTRNLMEGTKYNYRQHTDLIDELTFFQPSNYFSATKRFNLDFYTRAFGIDSPKSHGVDGTVVSSLFVERKFVEIANYCLRDVIATWELFKIWDATLKF